MKTVVRLLSLLTLIALIAGLPLSALAQDGENALCGGLSPEDCELLLTAQGNMATVTSFAIPAMTISFSFNDGTQTTAFSMNGSGEIMLPESGSLLVHLLLTDIVMEPASEDVPSELEVILNDTMGYVLYNGEWYGEELSEEDQAQVAEIAGMTDVSSLGSADSGLDLSGVVTTARGEDVDGMAAFKTDLDVAGLLTAVLSSPMLGEVLGEEQAAELGLGELSPEDMAMMGMMFAPLLADTTISFEEWVGLDDMYLHKLALNVALSIDLSMFGGEGSSPLTGGLVVEIGMDNFNETFEVTPPAEYRPMDELDVDLGEVVPDMGM
jgi:hypothetical protein